MNKNIALSKKAAVLVKAQQNLCWVNATNLMAEAAFAGATYVEGAMATPKLGWPKEHGWIVFNGEIIDPTLPEMELQYFPAHQWPGNAFDDLFFKYSDKPFYQHIEFKVRGVQVEMDRAKAEADAWLMNQVEAKDGTAT